MGEPALKLQATTESPFGMEDNVACPDSTYEFCMPLGRCVQPWIEPCMEVAGDCPSSCVSWKGDGVCDEDFGCNIESCDYDGGDCNKGSSSTWSSDGDMMPQPSPAPSWSSEMPTPSPPPSTGGVYFEG